MKVTVKTLAEAAGVSRGTVDRVLHGRGAVKPEVALRIKTLAREFGYVPNRAGRALAAFKTPYKIGTLLPSIGNRFFDDVITGINQAREEYSDLGIEVILKEVQGFDVQEHLEAVNSLVKKGCRALCLSTIDVPEMRERINELCDRGIVVILVNTDVSDTRRLCYVGSDYTKAGATCGCMLSMFAHVPCYHILVVTGSRLMLGHNQRIEGFKKALGDNGVSYDIVETVESSDSDIIAQEKTLKALREHEEINCVYVTGSGVQGVGAALIALQKTDLMAIAFDDLYTTKELVLAGIIKFIITQQPQRQGYHAIKRAYQALAGQIGTEVDDFITDTIIKIKANL